MTDCKRRVEATVHSAGPECGDTLYVEADLGADFADGDRVVVVDAAWLEEVERLARAAEEWDAVRSDSWARSELDAALGAYRALLSRPKEDADG